MTLEEARKLGKAVNINALINWRSPGLSKNQRRTSEIIFDVGRRYAFRKNDSLQCTMDVRIIAKQNKKYIIRLTPRWICQEITTCAGVMPNSLAIALT